MGAPHTLVPPSPGIAPPAQGTVVVLGDSAQAGLHPPPLPAADSVHFATGVRKSALKQKPVGTFAKLLGAPSVQAVQKSFRFMDLPGGLLSSKKLRLYSSNAQWRTELRNMVYHHLCSDHKQALLVHRPRISSLRSRTRFDRSRPLLSEVVGQEHDTALSTMKRNPGRRNVSAKTNTGPLHRECHRPSYGLTQVCHLIREEFRPIYMQKQEIGLDLTDTSKFLGTFFPDALVQVATLPSTRARSGDLPYTGNLTIAVSEKICALECSDDGIDILPLLGIWANSYKIEAGFGRYLKAQYHPQTDGEAKDL